MRDAKLIKISIVDQLSRIWEFSAEECLCQQVIYISLYVCMYICCEHISHTFPRSSGYLLGWLWRNRTSGVSAHSRDTDASSINDDGRAWQCWGATNCLRWHRSPAASQNIIYRRWFRPLWWAPVGFFSGLVPELVRQISFFARCPSLLVSSNRGIVDRDDYIYI